MANCLTIAQFPSGTAWRQHILLAPFTSASLDALVHRPRTDDRSESAEAGGPASAVHATACVVWEVSSDQYTTRRPSTGSADAGVFRIACPVIACCSEDTNPAQPRQLINADLECLYCGAEWNGSEYGSSIFMPVVDGTTVQCSACASKECQRVMWRT